MMKLILCFFAFLLPFLGRSGGQEAFLERHPRNADTTWLNITVLQDSILADADKLYRYEAAAWVTGDIAQELELLGEVDGYCSYGGADSIRSIVYGADSVRLFTLTVGESCYVDTISRPLTPWERRFIDMRDHLIDTVLSGSFPIKKYDGFDFNFVLMDQASGYKLYLMMGTRRQGVIPFGNDYIFFADSLGQITEWRQMHKSLLATDFGSENMRQDFIDKKISTVVHSHLQAEPMITSTDICLMRLYGPIYGVNKLKVLSKALDVYFEYTVDKNRLNRVPVRN